MGIVNSRCIANLFWHWTWARIGESPFKWYFICMNQVVGAKNRRSCPRSRKSLCSCWHKVHQWTLGARYLCIFSETNQCPHCFHKICRFKICQWFVQRSWSLSSFPHSPSPKPHLLNEESPFCYEVFSFCISHITVDLKFQLLYTNPCS